MSSHARMIASSAGQMRSATTSRLMSRRRRPFSRDAAPFWELPRRAFLRRESACVPTEKPASGSRPGCWETAARSFTTTGTVAPASLSRGGAPGVCSLWLKLVFLQEGDERGVEARRLFHHQEMADTVPDLVI